jgi:RNA polymerase sigma-70 factor (ECF subfamily)
MGESDQELLQRMSGGDEEAFATLYHLRQPAVYRYVLHMSANAATAEEITRRPGNYDAARGSLASYLFGVARNLLRRRLAEEARQVGLDERTEAETCPIEAVERAQEIDLVRRALVSLPWRYREAVSLCELQEVSYDEAARLAGCAVGTIRSRLHRAKALLEAKLRRSAQGCAL